MKNIILGILLCFSSVGCSCQETQVELNTDLINTVIEYIENKKFSFNQLEGCYLVNSSYYIDREFRYYIDWHDFYDICLAKNDSVKCPSIDKKLKSRTGSASLRLNFDEFKLLLDSDFNFVKDDSYQHCIIWYDDGVKSSQRPDYCLTFSPLLPTNEDYIKILWMEYENDDSENYMFTFTINVAHESYKVNYHSWIDFAHPAPVPIEEDLFRK